MHIACCGRATASAGALRSLHLPVFPSLSSSLPLSVPSLPFRIMPGCRAGRAVSYAAAVSRRRPDRRSRPAGLDAGGQAGLTGSPLLPARLVIWPRGPCAWQHAILAHGTTQAPLPHNNTSWLMVPPRYRCHMVIHLWKVLRALQHTGHPVPALRLNGVGSSAPLQGLDGARRGGGVTLVWGQEGACTALGAAAARPHKLPPTWHDRRDTHVRLSLAPSCTPGPDRARGSGVETNQIQDSARQLSVTQQRRAVLQDSGPGEATRLPAWLHDRTRPAVKKALQNRLETTRTPQ